MGKQHLLTEWFLMAVGSFIPTTTEIDKEDLFQSKGL